MATKEQLKPFFQEIYKKSNLVVEILLVGYFIFGIGLSFFYDTYLVAFGVGFLSLVLYFGSKFIFKGSTINQYMASLVAVIFMAQFIYQMHGLFEMHFTAFIAIIAIITYQNKYVFLPALLFVVIHHSSFAYIQYLGYNNNNEVYQQIYFTQLDYMDFQTFLFHAGLYALGVVLAAIYAHNLEKNTIKNAENIIKLQKSEKSMTLNIDFANDIAEGKFETEYSRMEGDRLGAALEEMRNNLKSSSERENQEKFTNVGIAEVSEIIRSHGEDLNELSYGVVSYLVKYLKINQGGIFIMMEDGEDKWLELKGCYAYDRKKFAEKRIEPGQGLIGQCYLEREMIYLKEVPEDYVTITSGLGEATPSHLVILPIKNDQIIEGVLELASFSSFEKHELEFLDRVCENMAASITSAKVNARTKILYEQSQQQAEEMRAQEEEMRQNMEELSATQEEMERKSKESENRLNAINTSGIGTIEFDLNGIIRSANETFCTLMKYTKEEIVDNHHRIFVDPEYANSDEYQKFWIDLAKGTSKQGQYLRYDKLGNPVYLFGSYSVITNDSGEPMGVHKFAVDITSQMTEIDSLKKANDLLSEKLSKV
ncbi:MAG: GAF domain-containing protein [Bacteroidota bacterium]